MAGHSKWSNIKHKKAAQDKKRAKIFTRLIREIAVAARSGSDPNENPRLRLAWDRALAANMPKDNIERAARRGAGESSANSYDEVRYEGYGPRGAAIIVDCLTDNRNRTVSDVRYAFSRNGGNVGADGSVAFMFDRKGEMLFSPETDSETVLELALEAGAEDLVEHDDGSFEVLTDPAEFSQVKQAIEEAGFIPAEADVTMRPQTTVQLSGKAAQTCMKLLDAIEDIDDVQNVYCNVEFDDQALAQAENA